MSRKISILSTATIGNGMVEYAKENGIDLDIVPFIEVRNVDEVDLLNKVLKLAEEQVTVVFTSKHAVQSVAKMLNGRLTNWSIYCLGNKTKGIVSQYFIQDNIVSLIGDSADLAAKLITDGVKNITFFCGDRRMDTLPDKMKNKGANVQEYVVYTTIDTPHIIKKKYDGILFFSPSGVGSFFEVNGAKEGLMYFAIGDTTADTIRKHTGSNILISEVSTKEQVLLDAIKYFKTI